MKIRDKKIFDIEGSPFWIFQEIETWKIKKTSKGPPFGKKNFVSDFDETHNFKSLGPGDFTHKIWAESETKIFLT